MSGFLGSAGSRSGLLGERSWDEEGTWTPTVTLTGGATSTGDSGNSLGQYFKIGKMVYISLYVQNVKHNSSGTFTGDASITNLPYTCSTNTKTLSFIPFHLFYSNTAGQSWKARAKTNSAVLDVFAETLDFTKLDYDDFGNFSDIGLSGWYFTD